MGELKLAITLLTIKRMIIGSNMKGLFRKTV